mgnify:CR=1 FL=1
MAMLEVKNLGISFGGLRAVDDFHISIEKGQLYGLIGPNGAGKTTVFNMLTGVYTPDEGTISLDGADITGKKTIDINKAGIARTFQNIRLFKDQSVLDNVKIGLHNQMSYSTLTGILRLPKYRKVEAEMDEKAMELLKCLIWSARRVSCPPIFHTESRESLRLRVHLQRIQSCCCSTSRRQA